MQDHFAQKVNELHEDIIQLIAHNLSPIALKYNYSDVDLETKIKWKPFVLILGNYSSGKSTLINDFLGFQLQNTGQAPTDDSFTVITGENYPAIDENKSNQLLYEKNGHSLFNNPKYPFSLLKKYGDTLASHFKLKAVRSKKLQNLALIDTPGMLDTTTEKDRGYNYQQVIGDLASCADIVLILFDAHKAGTLKEAYESLRDTLPEKIFEDRIVYVLNRIDECGSLEDMIRVYGTLCWNLSQITGRKDIPRILLTYSQEENNPNPAAHEYLKYLDNQQEELRKTILKAPKKRLDHLANFLEDQGSYLKTLVQALLEFTRRKKVFYLKSLGLGFILSFIISFMLISYFTQARVTLSSWSLYASLALGSGLSYLSYLFVKNLLFPRFMKKLKENLEQLTELHYQKNIDTWNKVKNYVEFNLERNHGKLSSKELKKELSVIERSYRKSRTAIRASLDKLDNFEMDPEESNNYLSKLEGRYV